MYIECYFSHISKPQLQRVFAGKNTLFNSRYCPSSLDRSQIPCRFLFKITKPFLFISCKWLHKSQTQTGILVTSTNATQGNYRRPRRPAQVLLQMQRWVKISGKHHWSIQWRQITTVIKMVELLKWLSCQHVTWNFNGNKNTSTLNAFSMWHF